MRVLMVSNLWPPEILGGAERMAGALADRLEAAGHEVGVVTLAPPAGTALDPRVVATVPAFPYPIRDAPTEPAPRRALFHAADLHRRATARALDYAFAELRPDVVHSHAVQGLSTVALTHPARRGYAHVHTIHDYWLLCQRNSLVRRDGTPCDALCTGCALVSGVRNASVRRAAPDVLLAVSKAVALAHERLPWARDRLRVLYNPVEVVAAARQRRAPGAPVTFGYLGRLAADKGVVTLLAAFARSFPAGDAGARLLVAGRGPLERDVRSTANAEYRGWVDGAEKEALLAEVDVVVVPSEWPDPAPLVVNEARARGIAVVGARSGGIPELVAPECEPLLFPAGDVPALSDRLVRAAAAPPVV
ncbi:MAG: glycosyltransferase, partial [Actinobacteria bacterium]|nr:glycosyltransferase [Actinomycetota bacterium]